MTWLLVGIEGRAIPVVAYIDVAGATDLIVVADLFDAHEGDFLGFPVNDHSDIAAVLPVGAVGDVVEAGYREPATLQSPHLHRMRHHDDNNHMLSGEAF